MRFAITTSLRLQRLAKIIFRLVVFGPQRQHFAEMALALCNVDMIFAEQGNAPFERSAHQRGRRIVESEALVDRADRVHQCCLGFGLVGEFRLDPRCALVEDFARRNAVAE